MDQHKLAKMAKIKWGWIAVSFIFGAWPVGVAMIVLKVLGDQAEEEMKKERILKEQKGFWDTTIMEDFPFQDVKARPVQEKKSDGTTQWQGSSYRSTAKKSATVPGNAKARKQAETGTIDYRSQANRALMKLLNPKKGKGLQIAGGILLALACFGGTMNLLSSLTYDGLLEGLMGMVAMGFTVGLPGLAMLVTGTNKRKRNARCRNHLAMIGNRRTVSLDEIDAASPGNFKTVCKDLEWMLGQGFFPGAYLDMGRRVFTYPGEQPPMKEERSKTPRATRDSKGRKVYPEEQTIRQLDDQIQDAYVSQRIQRLAQLTHQIFAYVEENPEKEHKTRQFKNHYLPKTINILEAYARMERQNVSGSNIRGAMEDVEQIMDKLVAGFEKQLDALFDSEAMDVSTDINVLESMMNMEGLGGLDPFGSAANQKKEQTQ